MNTIIIKDKNSTPRVWIGKDILAVRHPKVMPKEITYQGVRYPVIRYTSVDGVVYAEGKNA